MNYTVTFDIDSFPDGSPRQTKSKDYRFTLIYKDENGKVATSIRGFRLDKDFTRISPPATVYYERTYNIAILGRELEDRLIDAIKTSVQEAREKARNRLEVPIN